MTKFTKISADIPNTDEFHMANEHLLRICAELKQNGKQPSVGLVKAKAGNAFQLAAIIAAVQFFKANPDWQPTQQAITPAKLSKSDDELEQSQLIARIASLEKQVAKLEQQLDAIQQHIGK